MPIRFRCAYCQQLMGIGHRKAGAIVRCPRCAGEVIVPAGNDGPANGAAQPNDFLESEDFGKVLAKVELVPHALPNPPSPHPPVPLATSGPDPTHHAPESSVSCNVQRSGLFVPTPMLLVAAILLIACLVVAFGLGVILSRWMGP
jgi:hypothetical protein